MFGWGPATRIYLAAGATDMRSYAPSIVMWSRGERGLENPRRTSLGQRGELHIT
jgi:hypothetical protein